MSVSGQTSRPAGLYYALHGLIYATTELLFNPLAHRS